LYILEVKPKYKASPFGEIRPQFMMEINKNKARKIISKSKASTSRGFRPEFGESSHVG